MIPGGHGLRKIRMAVPGRGKSGGARVIYVAVLDQRSIVLASYALCGFANFSSIAIQIGGIGALAPTRRADIARLGLKSMIAGLLACYLFAAVVGVLI